MATVKRTQLCSIIVSALIFGMIQAPLAVANDEEEGSGVYLSGGWNKILFDNDRSIEDDDDFYAGLGYHINPQFAIEVTLNRADTQISGAATSDIEFNYWSLSAVHRFTPIGESGFFGRGGIGLTQIDTEFGTNKEEAAIKLGTGYDLHLTSFLVAQLAIDASLSLEREQFDFIPSAGLMLYMGFSGNTDPETYAQEDEQYKDTDNDGVIDSADQCPGSVAGADVDAAGCLIVVEAVVETVVVVIDADNDGVIDESDTCLDTEAGVAVDETGCNAVLFEAVSIDIKVQFPNNSSIIAKSNYAEIEKAANFMKQYPNTQGVIEGHTDATGADAYNQMMSERRANAVMEVLVNKFGIDASRLTALGKGEASPIASNDTAEGRAENRRVTAIINNAPATNATE